MTLTQKSILAPHHLKLPSRLALASAASMQDTAVVKELLLDLKRAFILSVPPYGVRGAAAPCLACVSTPAPFASFPAWQAEQVRSVIEKMVALWEDSEQLQQYALAACAAPRPSSMSQTA